MQVAQALEKQARLKWPLLRRNVEDVKMDAVHCINCLKLEAAHCL